MKTGRAELKRRARQALRGHYGTAIGGYLLYMVISGVLVGVLEVAIFFMIMAGGFVADQTGLFDASSG